MKKTFTLLAFFILLCGGIASAQNNAQHPITSAKIAGVDGRVELVFDEPVSDAFTICVMDLTGKVIFSQSHPSAADPCQFVEIPVENLKRGIYMVRVTAVDGKTKNLKLQRN
ncbi:MAG: hypothetical protein ACKO7B_03770 [Flavobacteriales bacterium]